MHCTLTRTTESLLLHEVLRRERPQGAALQDTSCSKGDCRQSWTLTQRIDLLSHMHERSFLCCQAA